MASLTPAMAAWWHSGVAEKVEGEFFGHGEITHMLPTYANMPMLPVERITACSSSAWTMAARWRFAQRRDGAPAANGPNWPN